MSELRNRLRLSLDTPGVRLTDCDGYYRAYQNDVNELWYLAAFTRQADRVTRTIYGPTFNGQKFPCFFVHELDAECAAAWLNARIG